MIARALAAALAVASLAAVPAASAATRWSRIDTASTPSPRGDHALAGAGGRAYLFGGRGPRGALGDLWVIDIGSARPSWRRLRPRGSRPGRRFGHNLVAAPDGTLLLFGGQRLGRFFGDTWRYEPRRNRWRRLRRDGPSPRYGAAGDLHGRSLVVSHGFTDRGRFDDTWRIDGASADELSPARRPSPRCLLSGAAYRGRFFIFGGQSNQRPFLGDLWRLDVRRRAWRRLGGRAPSARNLYGAARDGRHWYVHGGRTASGAAGDLWRLDLRSGRFRRVAPRRSRPAARSSHAMAAVSRGRIVLFGGAGAADRDLADTWILSAD